MDIIDSNGCGLEKNWTIMALAEDEGCALIDEESKSGKYKVVFTNNLKLVTGVYIL
jgi:hypothetical protein